MKPIGWDRVVVMVASMAFVSFVLYLTASHFDASELKAIGGLAVGVVGKEVLPAIMRLLAPSTELLSRGQVE